MLCNRRSCLLVILLAGCANNKTPSPIPEAPVPRVIVIRPGPNVQEEAQRALIEAQPGDVIEFAEGTHEFTQGLSLAVEGVTVRGRGMDKTTLSFKNQAVGSAGLLVTRGRFRLEDLSLDDAKGDAVKIQDADGVALRRVRAQWSGEAKETNGPYGLYPVQCQNVLIEGCQAFEASDAGIYVGQSRNVIVRSCRAERNVAGIEIENCTDADVYDNVATDNAGGLLVFDLPGLPAKNGRCVRVFENQVTENNHANFAPKGNMVASVAPGTGLMLMATDEVEIFRNTVRDNQTYNLAVISFLLTGRPIQDKEYDPYPEGVSVHDNTFGGGGRNPGGQLAPLLVVMLGKPLPDIVYDGVVNPARLVDGKLPPEYSLSILRNPGATFANLHWDKLDVKKPFASLGRVTRDLTPHAAPREPLPPVRLVGVP
jgi:parallel beta-helix repeat protein